MRFYSEEWVQAVKDKANSDLKYQAKTKALNVTCEEIIEDYPGGLDVWVRWRFEGGKIVEALREEKTAPSEWRGLPAPGKDVLTRSYGGYQTWARLNKGEISAMEALVKRVYRIQGNMIKIMAKMGPLSAFTDLRGSIPCEY